MGTSTVQILNFGYTKAEFDALLASKEDFAKADNHEKRLSNIEQHLNPKYINTDERMAWRKAVPANACSSAQLNSIGGMTHRDETTNTLVDAKVTKLMQLVRKNIGKNMLGNEVLANAIKNSVEGATKDNPYGTVSFGASKASQFRFEDFKPNTQYTIILYGYNSKNITDTNLAVVYTDKGANGTTVDNIFFEKSDKTPSYAILHTDPSRSVSRFSGTYRDGTTYLYYDNCGIFEGKISLEEFQSYTEKTIFQTPAKVQALDDYGKGVNETYYNKVVWEDNKVYYHHTCRGIVLDGSSDEGWKLRTNVTTEERRYFYKVLTQDENVSLNGVCISNNYDRVDISFSNDVIGFNVAPFSGQYAVIVRPDDVATLTLEEFTARLAEDPLVVVYGVDSTKTDITDLFTSNNIIKVTAGGYIEFVNESGRAVPSSITYLLKESETA